MTEREIKAVSCVNSFMHQGYCIGDAYDMSMSCGESHSFVVSSWLRWMFMMGLRTSLPAVPFR